MWFGKRVAPGKRPLKVNVFAHMMAHQGMLEQLPLFPYLGPGDIVPTGALSLTLPDTPRVHFYHYNDIPEVILCMASEGGLISTGQLYLQKGTHGVTTFIRKPTGTEGQNYQISLIIVRVRCRRKSSQPLMSSWQWARIILNAPKRWAAVAAAFSSPVS